jgi:hypothetical protein
VRADFSAPIGFLERLPKWLICVPLVAQWCWLAARHGGLTLPSTANPFITAGGLVGERKTEYLETMGELARAAYARSTSLTVPETERVVAAERALRDAGLSLPVVAKPELGWCGYGVRRLATRESLAEYVSSFPVGEQIVLQEYLSYEGEAGVFYVRHPEAERGAVVAIALRHFARVCGDGRSTVEQLIARDARAQRLARDPRHRIEVALDQVPAAGTVVRLATIGSLRAGALYTNGSDLITPELSDAFDAIARDMKDFYFGRFDVRFDSEAALRRAADFRIVEVNGAGSEAIHAWDPKLSPLAALGILFEKQRLLFEIAATNRRRGHEPIGLGRLARLHLHQQRLIERYPRSG